MCEIALNLDHDRPAPALRLIAFAVALILAPFMATIVLTTLGGLLAPLSPGHGFALALVSAFALPLGYETYLLFGAPLFALLALGCHGGAITGGIVGSVAMFLAAQTTGEDSLFAISQFYAVVWGATFGFLYRKLVLQ